jgi:O-antigen/teichoic acid export membrane protein
MTTAEPAPGTTPEASGPSRAKGLSGVGLSSLAAAASGYLILFIAARTLTKAENADFLTFWAVLFFVFGVLSGIISETTRAVRAADLQPARAAGPRVLPVGLGIGLASALLLAGTSPLWAGALFPSDTALLVAVTAGAAVAYSGHAALAGATGGRQQWGLFASLAGFEALTRLAAVVLAAALVGSLAGLEAACVVGSLLWLAVLAFSARARRAAGARSDVPLPRLLRQNGHAMVSAAATATLITGFPILLKLTTPGAEYALAAPLILAVSLTRAPIMIPLQAFQSVLISSFVGPGSRGGLGRLLRPVGLLLAVGALGGLLAAWLGPAIMLVFGPGYSVGALTMGLLTFAAALMAVLTLTGTVCLARSAHRAYALGWLAATVGSFLVLLAPWPLEPRVVASLLAGPLVGIAVHCASIASRSGESRTVEPLMKEN